MLNWFIKSDALITQSFHVSFFFLLHSQVTFLFWRTFEYARFRLGLHIRPVHYIAKVITECLQCYELVSLCGRRWFIYRTKLKDVRERGILLVFPSRARLYQLSALAFYSARNCALKRNQRPLYRLRTFMSQLKISLALSLPPVSSPLIFSVYNFSFAHDLNAGAGLDCEGTAPEGRGL